MLAAANPGAFGLAEGTGVSDIPAKLSAANVALAGMKLMASAAIIATALFKQRTISDFSFDFSILDNRLKSWEYRYTTRTAIRLREGCLSCVLSCKWLVLAADERFVKTNAANSKVV